MVEETPDVKWTVKKEHFKDGWVKTTTTITKIEMVWVGHGFDEELKKFYDEYRSEENK